MPFQEPHATYEFLKAAGRAAGPARPSSSPTTARSSGPGPRRLITFIQMAGCAVSATCSWPIATGSSRRRSRGPSISTLPLGKVYLPDGSYREMTEWALPPESLRAFGSGAERLAALPDAGEIKRFFRAGGYWRNFKVALSRKRRDVRPDAGRLAAAGRGRRQTRTPTRITWRSPAESSIEASATVPTGMGRSAASICPTCGMRSTAA